MVLDSSLGVCVPRLVSGLGTSFLLLCLFGFEVLRGSRACSVGVLHFLLLFSFLALRISMGPSHSYVLRIGSNPAELSSSGVASPIVWLWWFIRLPWGNLLSPWIRVRVKLIKFDTLAALNI